LEKPFGQKPAQTKFRAGEIERGSAGFQLNPATSADSPAGASLTQAESLPARLFLDD
jgi:hypothetical protein